MPTRTFRSGARITLLAVVALLSLAPGGGGPNPCFTVSPSSGTVATTFGVNAGCSKPNSVKVRWDWESDGVWDTTLSSTKTASHQFTSEGVKTITLQVQDQSGGTATIAHAVTVVPPTTTGLGPLMSPFNEPDIAVNPVDSQNFVISGPGTGNSSSGMVDYPALRTVDGGSNWGQAAGVGPMSLADTGIEFDGAGVVYLSGLDPSGAVIVAKSTTKGLTYLEHSTAMGPTTLFRDPNNQYLMVCESGLLFDYPKMAVTVGSSIYLTAAWAGADRDGNGECDPGSGGVTFIRSVDGGQTWDAGQLFPGDIGTSTSAISVGADGAIYIADRRGPAPECVSMQGVSLRKSTNQGATFGNVTCAWNSNGDLIPQQTWIAAHPTDASKVWIAFDGWVQSLGYSRHIFIIRSTDGGSTWSTPVRVDEILANDVIEHARPSLSVSISGRLDIAWFDARNASPTSLNDVYYSYSADEGMTWARNIRLTNVTAPGAKVPGNDFLTVISTGQSARVAYSQNRDGDGMWELYLSEIAF